MGAMNQRSPIHFQWREVGGGGGGPLSGQESVNKAGPNLGKAELYANTQQYRDATDQSKPSIAHWISC